MIFFVGGDIAPTKSNFKAFASGDAESLIGEDTLALLSTGKSIFNLETPLVDTGTPIAKCGPNLIAPCSAMAALSRICPHAVGLANNHIMDQGELGLESTQRLLEASGIEHVGAGKNLSEAVDPLVLVDSGFRLGVYACAEHEFTVAEIGIPGANPFDPLESFDHVADLATRCDAAIVLYHGGKEHYRYPSPELRRRCRKFVDKGAKLVVCQHSHCIGCEERYKEGVIVYGQGNFLFDGQENEYWASSLLIEVETRSDQQISVTYHPLVKVGNAVRLATRMQAEKILAEFFKRSEQINEPGFVEDEYARLAAKSMSTFLGPFLPGSRTIFWRALNVLMGRQLGRRFITTKRAFSALNYIECEAHSELFIAGLKDYLSKKEKK